MNHTIDAREAEAGKVIYPEDKYTHCRIESVTPKKPFDADVKWNYEVKFVAPDFDTPIIITVKYKDRNGPKSYYHKLLSAIYPVVADRVGKNPAVDWVNEEITIMCQVGEFQGKPCNNFSFSPSK